MAVQDLRRYQAVVAAVLADRGHVCEACGKPAHHVHHIIRVSDSRIHSELVYEPANMLVLCDECHALMHPLLRNVSQWKGARKRRGATLIRRT